MEALISERDFIRVDELSRIFDISKVTVRSDLAQLADGGRILRVHGGATSVAFGSQVEPTYEESERSSTEEKAAIGKHAASLVVNGSSLIIDVGTTAAAVARALARRDDLEDVVVFTNSISTALLLEPAIPRISVVLTGGSLRPKQHSLVDPFGTSILSRLHVNLAFVGCNGLHPTGGATNINLPEAEMKAQMIAASQRTVVVAEGSKLGRISLARFASIDQIDLLITGTTATTEMIDQLDDAGVETVIAP